MSNIFAIGVLLSGLHYNLENIYHGMRGAKSTRDGVEKLIPYIQIYILAQLSGYSQFFESSVLLFYVGLGLFQTYIAGLLNIASTAGIDFPYLYIEPFIYIAILFVDANRLANPHLLVGAYSMLALEVLVKYCLFLHSITTQLTTYLRIPLLTVKQKK